MPNESNDIASLICPRVISSIEWFNTDLSLSRINLKVSTSGFETHISSGLQKQKEKFALDLAIN